MDIFKSIRDALGITTLPDLAPVTLHDALNVQDNLEHAAVGQDITPYRMKTVLVYATMVGAPGNLNVWVELAHQNVAASYVIVGVAQIFAATGDVLMPFEVYAPWCRVVAQIPAGAAGVANYWTVSTFLVAHV